MRKKRSPPTHFPAKPGGPRRQRQPTINKISFGKTTRKKTTCRKPIRKQTKRIAQENYRNKNDRRSAKRRNAKVECKVVQRKAKGKIRTHLNTLVGQRPRADLDAFGKCRTVPGVSGAAW